MKNKTTLFLGISVLTIIGIIAAGFLFSQPAPQQPVQKPTPQKQEPLPTAIELQALLAIEQPAITTLLNERYPNISTDYTVERASLYHRGEWYGAILQYKGSDVNNRDTLRIVLQKKNGNWVIKTPMPQLLVNKRDIPDAPISMLNDINRAAPLTGTETSPAITPDE